MGLKLIKTIFILSLIFCWFNKSYSQNIDENGALHLTYPESKFTEITLPGIPMKINDFYPNTTLSDSIKSGVFEVINAEIGVIKNCHHTWVIKNETLITTKITTATAVNSDLLLEQLKKQLGNPSLKKRSPTKTEYRWKNSKINTLTVSKKYIRDSEKGTLLLQIEP